MVKVLVQFADGDDVDNWASHVKAPDILSLARSKVDAEPLLTKVRRQSPDGIVCNPIVAAHGPKATLEGEELHGTVNADLIAQTGTEKVTDEASARGTRKYEEDETPAKAFHA